MSYKKVLILDTGKEWGGGTNSLLALLERIDRKRYRFSALFYNNYRMGRDSDIKSELTKLGVEFIERKSFKKKALAKPLKELARTAFFLSPELKKRSVFYLDFKNRILPDSRVIEEVLSEGGFDLLYMNNQPSSNLEGLLAARAAGVPCIQHSRVAVRLNPVETEAVNAAASRVICVSKGVRDDLVKDDVEPERCTVVYNGIDTGLKPPKTPEEVRRELGIDEGNFVIGTVGSLIKRKRMGLLIEAVAAIDEKGLKCVIVGEGPLSGELKGKAASLGLSKNVIFTGFRPDALSYINAMDVFVLPSEKEGLPRVVLEAMLMKKPVVAFNVTGPNELVVDNATGLLVKDGPSAAGALACAVKKLVADKEDVAGVEAVFGEVLG
jgi:glycosyltransferase involved in cell wall biosynthesis